MFFLTQNHIFILCIFLTVLLVSAAQRPAGYGRSAACFPFPIRQRYPLCGTGSSDGAIPQHLYLKASGARAVELTEIHTLPSPQQQASVLDQHQLARANATRLQMRGGVPLRMPERAPVGKGFAQPQQQVVPHVRISVFIDRDAGGRVRTVYDLSLIHI